jgi:hypothetical protein
MKPAHAPICHRSLLEQQLGPIVTRLWVLPRPSTLSGAIPGADDQMFSPELARRELQRLEADLETALAPAQPAADGFVLLH